MKAKKTSSNVGRKKVSFNFYGPDAKEVCVVGDFNQWRPEAHLMKLEDDGVWRKSLFVIPGTYEYKFKVNGKWKNDPDNPMTCGNSYGTKNNLIVVKKK